MIVHDSKVYKKWTRDNLLSRIRNLEEEVEKLKKRTLDDHFREMIEQAIQRKKYEFTPF